MTTTSGKFVLLTLALSLVLFLAPGYAPRAAGNVLEPFPLPEFTGKNQSSWFNSAETPPRHALALEGDLGKRSPIMRWLLL